jgi:hypothetical protein
MAYLQDIFLQMDEMNYHGKGRFTGTCRSDTCTASCLEVVLNQPNRESDEKYYSWLGEFYCKRNCSKSKILSNLNMYRYQIFFDPKLFESDPEEYHCLFDDHEAKEFLKEEINFLYKVLQKPEFDWEKELENYDLRFLSDAIFWLEKAGRYCFTKKSEKERIQKSIKYKNEAEKMIDPINDEDYFFK